jgi:hypothetical protein
MTSRSSGTCKGKDFLFSSAPDPGVDGCYLAPNVTNTSFYVVCKAGHSFDTRTEIAANFAASCQNDVNRNKIWRQVSSLLQHRRTDLVSYRCCTTGAHPGFYPMGSFPGCEAVGA